MKRTILTGGLAALLTLSIVPYLAFGQVDGWTLDRCLSEAMTNSHRLNASRAQASAAQAAAEEASADRLPTVGMTGSYSWVSEVMKFQLTSPIPGITLPSVDFGDGSNADVALVARSTLYAGGALTHRASAERAGARASLFDVTSDSLNLAAEVRKAYFAVLGAEAAVRAAQRGEDRLNRHLEELSAARKAGMSTDENRIQVEASLALARRARISAESDARTARLILGNLIGHPGEEIEPMSDLDDSLVKTTYVADEVGGYPELIATDARIERTGQLARAAKGSFLPAVGVQAAFHYGKPGVNQIQNEWMDYATVGINLNWTLWDFNSRSAKVQQAKAAERALNESRIELSHGIQTRMEVTRSVYEAARGEVEQMTSRVDLLTQRLELVKNRTKNGMASESERLDAEDDLTLAEVELAATRVRLRLAEADYLRAMGK